MTIETASGQEVQNVTEDQVKKSLAGLGGSNDFLILSDEGDYIQCAVSDAGFIAEYQDGSGHYSSAPGLSAGVIEEMFTSYLSKSGNWKTLTDWTQTEFQGGDSEHERPASFADALKGDLSAEKLIGAVRSQVSREVGNKASGLIGKLVRKILK